MEGNYLQICCLTLVSWLFAFFVFPDVTLTLYFCITSDPLLNGILHQVTFLKDEFTLYVAIFGGILGTWAKIHFINYRRFTTFVWRNKQAWLRKHKVTVSRNEPLLWVKFDFTSSNKSLLLFVALRKLCRLGDLKNPPVYREAKTRFLDQKSIEKLRKKRFNILLTLLIFFARRTSIDGPFPHWS